MGMTKTAAKTLATMIERGGEMNSYAGQRGFDMRSLGSLRTSGLIEDVAECAGCHARRTDEAAADAKCERPLTGQGAGSDRCNGRVRVTAAGRAA